MAVSFEQSSRQRPPGWLRRKWGRLWDDVLRWILDATQQAARQALYCRYPLLAPSDALEYIGRERMIERGPDVPESTYREFLDNAWVTWAAAGTTPGIEQAIEDYFSGLGVTNVQVYSMNDDWLDDGNATNRSRLWVVIGQPNPWDILIAGPGVVAGPDVVAGTTMTRTEYNAARRVFRRHRPAHMLGVGLVLLHGGTTEVPADIAGDPTLAVVEPNVEVPLGKFVGYPGGATAGAATVVGYEIEEL